MTGQDRKLFPILTKGTFHTKGRGILTDIYTAAKEVMQKGDIAHWQSDLYLRKNSVSIGLVKHYEQRACVKEFVDPVDGDIWFEIGCAYIPFWHGQRYQELTKTI